MVSEEQRRQYTSAYGPFQAGDYAIGDELKAQGGVGGIVIWSYQSERGFMYVVEPQPGEFPVEVAASAVRTL